jgi:WD40 repeat protein
MAVTCGADMTVRLLDSRSSLSQVESIDLSDYPYSITAAGGLLAVGCGDGRVHVIDLATMQALYVLGANLHAVRTLTPSANRLVCSGDDGCCTIYNFS